ncbi:MAG: hypothetical protein JWO98_2451, partial [Frankiales bacterium]|nr:hypothetical protein [Frankiales bacterium]
NGCGQKLGDADDRDVDKRGNLTDVRAECPACLPVVELERAGCKTWHLNPRSLTENSFARLRKQAKAYTEPDAQGRLTLRGIALDAGPGAEPVVARFGDWIIRHPDGRWSVRKAEAAGEVTR